MFLKLVANGMFILEIHMLEEQGVPKIGGQWDVYFGNAPL